MKKKIAFLTLALFLLAVGIVSAAETKDKAHEHAATCSKMTCEKTDCAKTKDGKGCEMTGKMDSCCCCCK